MLQVLDGRYQIDFRVQCEDVFYGLFSKGKGEIVLYKDFNNAS